MKKCITFLCIFGLGYCKPRQLNFIDRKQDVIGLQEGEYNFNFKQLVFQRCLEKMYPSSFKNMVDSLDRSKAANREWLQYNETLERLADSLATDFVKSRDANYTFENGKLILNSCVDFRVSKKLDSLTKIILKQNGFK